MTRKQNRTLRKSIYRKSMWNDQISSFHSWISISRRRNLIISLATSIQRIYSPDVKHDDLGLLKEIFIINGHPSIFIDKNIKSKPLKTQITSVEKKTLYMDIDFKGNRAIYVLKRRISDSLKKNVLSSNVADSILQPVIVHQQS